MTEILTSETSASQMQSFLCTLINWTLENDMRINTSKTKELVIGPWGHQHNATSLQTDSARACPRLQIVGSIQGGPKK